jgi:hypothetical protein
VTTRSRLLVVIALGLTLQAVSAAMPGIVLVEAEGFGEPGGWVVDQQFMDQMGSPFLLAHGLGRPVADATTKVTFPEGGRYHVWVRTRNWVGQWVTQHAPGRFQLAVGGELLPTTFGMSGSEWAWHRGGEIRIDRGATEIALHDLTGFEGRCDAVLFSRDGAFVPPNDLAEVTLFRRRALGLADEPDDEATFDLVVVGGGTAGTCAAIAGTRSGLRVALIQDRPVLGGNNSSEVRVWLQGATNGPAYPKIGDLVNELEQARKAHYGPGNTADIYEDEKKLALAAAERGLTLLVNHRMNEVDTRDGRIRSVVAQSIVTARRIRCTGRWFVDATGDGCVGFLAGADWDMTRKGHMGRCNLWNVADAGVPVTFPRCPWALDLSDKQFPGRAGKGGVKRLGGWYWESGFDHDPFTKGEYIRDWNFRAMYGAWDCLKNVDNVYPNHRLNWAAYISGKRESRRLLGDVVLNKEHLMAKHEFADGCVVTGWKIDLHLPDPRYEKGFEGDAFISRAHFTSYPTPFHIPYRCFYSRNIANLFMAGRCVSVTHDALGTVRVMKTGGLMGEVVGIAAGLCQRYDCLPRDIYAEHLDALLALLHTGIGKPPRMVTEDGEELLLAPVPSRWGRNVAAESVLATNGSRDEVKHPLARCIDGVIAPSDNAGRWLSAETVPSWLEFRWTSARSIGAARVVSGFRSGRKITAPIWDFSLQVPHRGEWRNIPGTKVSGNGDVDWRCSFAPVTTDRVRLLVTKTQVNVARIHEVELYVPEGGRTTGGK